MGCCNFEVLKFNNDTLKYYTIGLKHDIKSNFKTFEPCFPLPPGILSFQCQKLPKRAKSKSDQIASIFFPYYEYHMQAFQKCKNQQKIPSGRG